MLSVIIWKKILSVRAGKLGNNRMTIVLEDQSFVETVGGLGRLISFCRIVFPALFAAVCLLGFVISWLMTGSRRMEFAHFAGPWNLRNPGLFHLFSWSRGFCACQAVSWAA